VVNYSKQVVKWALMDSAYLRSIWKLNNEEKGEEKAHACLEEVYSKKGFTVRNLHRDDRRHEAGIDLLCTRSDRSIGFAVKRKPKKKDISQLKKLADSDPSIIKFYVYLDSPTRPFEHAMQLYTNVHYLNWSKFHSLLVLNGSVNYILLYFAAHNLFENLSNIYYLIYEKRTIKQYKHPLDLEETEFMWNIKDDAVKLKSSFEYLQAAWRSVLMTRPEYNRKEWVSYIAKLHADLDIINNIAGESLYHSFITMSDKFPHFVALYWKLASYRTVWKDFTAMAIALGKRSLRDLKEFIRHKWVVPTLEPSKRSTEYGPIRSVYSALWAVVESTYRIANDIEDAVDWLHHELIF
jgi:hypothetical protein